MKNSLKILLNIKYRMRESEKRLKNFLQSEIDNIIKEQFTNVKLSPDDKEKILEDVVNLNVIYSQCVSSVTKKNLKM